MSNTEVDRCEFWVSTFHRVCMSGKHNFEGERIQVNDKWDFDYLERELQEYHDKQVIEFFRYGWPLNAIDTEVQPQIPPNQKGARENGDKIDQYLRGELSNGSIIGPFLHNPFGKKARFSPLDTRKKRDSDELRVILNLSYPFEKGSVNHSISKEHYVG